MTNHKRIHAPEHQVTAPIHTARPGCYATTREPKGEVTEGWPDGVKPGVRNPFWMEGRRCGATISKAVWDVMFAATSGCAGCARGWQDGDEAEA